MEEIDKLIQKAIHLQNHQALDDFEGYSPIEMQTLLYNLFNKESVVQLKRLHDSDYEKIPMFNQIKYLFELIKQKELKLTKKGFLPIKIVKAVYEQGYLKDYFIEKGISKLYKEQDTHAIHIARIILELTCLVKKKNNTLSVTKKGLKLSESNVLFFKEIFDTFITKFNWSYSDYYDNEDIGQMGLGFTCILLKKYGNETRRTNFYAKKYYNAFYKGKTDEYGVYSIRTFDRFLKLFGLVELDDEFLANFVKKTPLFDKLIEVKPHKSITF